jgi:WD40 repeat protein
VGFAVAIVLILGVIENGGPALAYSPGPSAIDLVAISPDGRWAFSAIWDYNAGSRKVSLWDATTGVLVRRLDEWKGSVNSVAFSPDARRVLAGGLDQALGDLVKLWDAETGLQTNTLRFERATAVVRSVAFSPDGPRALSQHRSFELWDAVSGQLIRTFDEITDPVFAVAFLPGAGSMLCGDDRGAKLWDVRTGQLIRTFEGSTAYHLAISLDGRRVAATSGNLLKLWNRDTGQLIRTLQKYEDSIHAVAFSPDGRRILSGNARWVRGAEDDPHHGKIILRLWDIDTGLLIRTFETPGDPHPRHHSPNVSVAFSPDGRIVISGAGDGTIKVWGADTGEVLGDFTVGVQRTSPNR